MHHSKVSEPAEGTGMDFYILGPLEVKRGDLPVNLGGLRQQRVLAMLLLEAGRVVPIDRLIDAAWEDEPPPTAREQIQICISSLRRVIVGPDHLALIRTRSPGYLLRLDGCTLDALLFDTRVRQARATLSAGDAAGAAAGFRSALSLWRGQAMSSISSTLVQRCVTHLNERRLGVLEECIEIELNTSLGHDLISELISLTQQNPLRERFSIQLMIALYRAGRQADALNVYQTARSILREELGIEPSGNLRRLHQAILAGRAVANAVGQQTRTAGTAPAQSCVAVPPAQQRSQRAVPMLLPAAIPGLTGRSGLIHQLLTQMNDEDGSSQALPITVLHGRGGVGKTTIAVHLAHRVSDRFPDGQLFAQLHTGSRSTVSSADILGRFLRALGVSDPSIPDDGEERAEMYRNLLAKRRILVVLDQVLSEDQIAPLLPGSPRCSVLVTSRRRLAGLSTARRIEIETMSLSGAVAMLSQIVGAERIRAEPEAADQLCKRCDCLPLALHIVAARLAARPHLSIAAMADRLMDESRRLDELNYGDMGLRASLSLSYDALSQEARRLFRLLSLFEVPSFSPWVGVALLQTDPLHAEDFFEELVEAHLLSVDPHPASVPVGYRFHEIVRPFARECLLQLEDPHERRAALKRLIGALLYLTSEATSAAKPRF
jgi:DNA-binding SARP family transcriptional activator